MPVVVPMGTAYDLGLCSRSCRWIDQLKTLIGTQAMHMGLERGELGIQSWELGVSYPGGGDARVHFEVTEVFKFTTTLQISLHAVVPHLLNDTKLVVRMYHDARMAEVVQSTSGGQFKGKYAYPNRRMYHSDEKVQLNHYLGECLNQCVRFGHVLTDLVPPGVVCN